MAKDRTQLNINIDPDLLLRLKKEATKSGKTLTEFVTEQLLKTSTETTETTEDNLEKRLDTIPFLDKYLLYKDSNFDESSLTEDNSVSKSF